jgi:hypothetical protein
MQCGRRMLGEDTFARRMKMSKKGKHGAWNKTKKTSGIPFTLEKLRETADVIKLIKFSNIVYFSFIYADIAYNSSTYRLFALI